MFGYTPICSLQHSLTVTDYVAPLPHRVLSQVKPHKVYKSVKFSYFVYLLSM